MAKRFDKVLIVDLEATCWSDDPAGIAEQADQESEIIEIGICAYYPQSGNISPPKSIYTLPTSSKMSKYCTELVGYDWNFLRKNGIPFEGGLNRLRKEFGPKHRVMASWGNYDWYMISHQCLRDDKPFPFGRSHINIKELHALKRKLDKALGLEAALAMEKLEFEGVPHQGRDDAFNAAKILKKLLEE